VWIASATRAVLVASRLTSFAILAYISKKWLERHTVHAADTRQRETATRMCCECHAWGFLASHFGWLGDEGTLCRGACQMPAGWRQRASRGNLRTSRPIMASSLDGNNATIIKAPVWRTPPASIVRCHCHASISVLSSSNRCT
jgi:hypothetical protein